MSEAVLTSETGPHPTTPFPHLVKAEERNLSTDVDARGAYAEHALFFEAPLGIDGPRCYGSRESRWDHNGHNI